ncbi:hypothetical protein NLG97_g8316 [Lecanicillium saksenae]|uniref:Uncharacterized protein n=1 Tax=Lecanicillium saksenae TaxID=468837 RepID=A0ACC1QLN1_9HYPO|nr:hypothetical protein NLG97_g8316 [Lecanicillium saksenae]
MNWPTSKKRRQILGISFMTFVVSMATSIIGPAQEALMSEFHLGSVAAILPLSVYVFALGLGPVIGGSLSEMVGRRPIYLYSMPVGGLFTLGVALTHNFAAICILRFMAGFCWAPLLAVPSGTLTETFNAAERGPISALFILMPFLGPSLGPVIGSFLVNRAGWRWTQWTLLCLVAVCSAAAPWIKETFTPVLQRRLACDETKHKQSPARSDFGALVRRYASDHLLRPISMLGDPILGLLCLYVSINFGILFNFFAGIPFTFTAVYHFSLEQSGLVFLSISIGCLLGLLTITLCDVLIYRKKSKLGTAAPEHRLYPAMISCIGLPVGLFWFGWSARHDVSWASPAASIILFAWGNFVRKAWDKVGCKPFGLFVASIAANPVCLVHIWSKNSRNK